MEFSFNILFLTIFFWHQDILSEESESEIHIDWGRVVLKFWGRVVCGAD